MVIFAPSATEANENVVVLVFKVVGMFMVLSVPVTSEVTFTVKSSDSEDKISSSISPTDATVLLEPSLPSNVLSPYSAHTISPTATFTPV